MRPVPCAHGPTRSGAGLGARDMTTPEPISPIEADRALAGLEAYDRLIVAVSGGADSTALLHLLVEFAARSGLPPSRLLAVTVNHRLRPESAAEAMRVAAAAAALGVPHLTKTYDGPLPTAPFAQAWARDLRYRLLAEAARDGLIPGTTAAILTAHHQDDQAETLLMRLARGSGIDGLAGIRRRRVLATGVDLIRPLLGFPKDRLLASLIARGAAWIDDPSNTNQRFERVRLRARTTARADLGLTTPALALAAGRAGRASLALGALTDRFLASAGVMVHPLGWVWLDWPALLQEPDEIRLRALATIIASVGGQGPPSLGDLEALTVETGWSNPAGKTFGHCSFLAGAGAAVDIVREPGRGQPAPQPIDPGEAIVWDGRYRIRSGPQVPAGAELRWLTADGRAQALAVGGTAPSIPKAAILTLPSVWQGTALLAAPAIGIGTELLEIEPFRLRSQS